MRSAADPERIRNLARELGKAVEPGTKMYLTGGATAVLEGWRDSTVDVDVRFEPDSDAALSRLRDLKEEHSINVELASPSERGFDLDLDDVANLVQSGQVEPTRLLELFEDIESQLYRFPAVEPSRLRAAVESLAQE